jgi:transcriptional regulator with XRE-family HTH domain
MTDVGKLLRSTRQKLNLDQAELAARAATTQTYVSRVERGATIPALPTLERLFNAMGLRLCVSLEPVPLGNVSADELRREFLSSTAQQRLDEAMTLSVFTTGVAAAAAVRGQDMGRAKNPGEDGGAERRSAQPITRLNPAELLKALQQNDVSFVVIGGFSLAAHGVVRATKDVDIVPDPSAANVRRLARTLRSIDAEVDLGGLAQKDLGHEPDEEGLAIGGNWVLQTKHGRLDVMQDVPGLRSWQHLRSTAVDVGGVLYAGYEELISMKSASARDEDLTDIAKLRAARSEA